MTRLPTVSTTSVLVIAVVSVGLLSGIGATSVTADDGFVYLTTSTTPEQPTTSGDFTLTTVLNSANASTDTYRIERMEVRSSLGSDPDVIEEKTYLNRPNPSLSPGGSVRQNFSIGFDSPGTHQVYIRMRLDAPGRDAFSVTHKIDIRVFKPNPRIEASAKPAVPGERTDVNVSIANGMKHEVRDVQLELSSPAVPFDERRRVASSIGSGETRSFAFTAIPDELGDHPVTARLTYTNASGHRRHVTRTLSIGFRPPDLAGEVGIAADVAPTIGGSQTSLNLTLTNGFDQRLRQFEIQLSGDGLWVKQDRRVGSTIDSGAERSFTFAVRRDEAGRQPIDVTVSYTTANGIQGQVTRELLTTFDEPENPGEVKLTGVQANQQDSELELSATASNVGSTTTDAVVVAIGDHPSIAPADYFVGSVEASDFASFTLTTDVVGNVSSVPLEVSYVVDGTERSFTTEIPVKQVATDRTRSGGGGLPLVPIAGGIVVVLVTVGLFLWWR